MMSERSVTVPDAVVLCVSRIDPPVRLKLPNDPAPSATAVVMVPLVVPLKLTVLENEPILRLVVPSARVTLFTALDAAEPIAEIVPTLLKPPRLAVDVSVDVALFKWMVRDEAVMTPEPDSLITLTPTPPSKPATVKLPAPVAVIGFVIEIAVPPVV